LKLPFYLILTKHSLLLGAIDSSMNLLDNVEMILYILQ